MAIEIGLSRCDDDGVWRDEELVTYVWQNDVSFEGMRIIRAPARCEPMIQETLMWMRHDAGLTDDEVDALGEADYLDMPH